MKKALRAIFMLLPFFVASSFSFAQKPMRDMAKERKLETQLAAIDPSLVETFKAATIAMDKNDYAAADSMYTQIYEKAPAFDVAVRRLGVVKFEEKNTEEGITLMEKALSMNRSSDNIVTLASYLLQSDGESGTLDLVRIHDLLNEGSILPDADDYEYSVLAAQADLKSNRIDDFNTIANRLLEKYPDKMASHYFAAISATAKEQWSDAEKQILLAKSMGLDDETVNQFLDSGVHEKAHEIHYTRIFLWILAFWAGGFLLLYLVGIFLSYYTLSSLERELKKGVEPKLASFFKNIYSFLINVAGVYYYVSLPIVLILVIVLVCGIFYLFLMVGRIPIQLMLLLVIGGCVTIYSMIRSLLVKVNYSDPGRELKESEAPGLFALTKEIAGTMGTRPIDEIRITPETDLAVYEKGSWREKFRDKGKRILILGTGVLKDFKQSDFRAVIAHEYGHFSHRDTAGGSVALRVRRDMHKYYLALFYAGQAVWWNVAFQFIRLYDFIFRRISNGSTRLQEVLADHVAAQTYSAESFKNGLTYVIRRQIEFVAFANAEIKDAQNVKRPFNNLYELQGTTTATVEEQIQKSLNRETTNDDTHPSPSDRFRFVEGLGVGKSKGGNEYVRDLFKDWNAITQEMTTDIENSWKNSGS